MSKKIVYILGGGIVDDMGHWRTTSFDEKGDMYGLLGDRLRVDAACSLYKKNPKNTLLVPSGSRGQLKDHPTAPTIAAVIRSELLELGVPDHHIMTEETSGNTAEQIMKLAQLQDENDWQEIIILTNRWHKLRAKAFLKTKQTLYDRYLNGNIVFTSAEEILLNDDPQRWGSMIKEAYSSNGMKERMAKEKEGVRAIENGTYKFS